MIRCAACQNDFSPPAAAVPYRCPRCQCVVLGHYRNLEWIGGGGMGDVYRAVDPLMGGRTVAIKIPLTEVHAQRAQQRFEREIAASARMEHENAVRAYQRGEEGGRPYLVMEFVAGRKLSELVRSDHPLSERRVARILLGIAKGLAHGQQQGIVNRDVKPENVLLAEPGETPKIHDYGLALITDVEEQVTRFGSLLGTASYVAPEQVRDPHSVTIAADVYSLGCTAYFCLAARPPFRGQNLDETIGQHAAAPRPGVRDVRPDVSSLLDALIREMMAADWRARPSPSAVVQRLIALAATLSDQSPRPGLPAGGRLIDAVCPGCGACYHVSFDSVGKRMRCPNKLCGQVFSVAEPPPAETDVFAAGGDEAVAAEAVDAEPLEAEEAVEAEVAAADFSDLPELAPAGAGRAEAAGLPGEEIADAEPTVDLFAARLAEVDGGVEIPHVEYATASVDEVADSQSDVETLPSEAIVTLPSRKKGFEDEPRTSRRQRRAANLRRLAVALFLLLCSASAVTAWLYWDRLGPPSPDQRWAEAMQLYDEHKWDRFRRELLAFQEDFPEDPQLVQIPFFLDMAKVGDDVYSLTGDAERGLAGMEEIFQNHRDNPAYKDYSIDIYQGLVKLIERLMDAAAAASQRDKLQRAGDGFELLETVAQNRQEPFVQEKVDELRSKLARAGQGLQLDLARRRITDLLQPEKIADPAVNVDEVYAEVAAATAANPPLGSDRQVRDLLESAYRAEAQRLRFEPEEAGAQAELAAADERDVLRQGCTLAVIWGAAAAGEGRAAPANPQAASSPPDSDDVVLSLARGILYAFDKSGRLHWARRLGIDSHRLPTPIAPTETSAAALIAVNAEDNQLLSLERATGRVLWRYRIGHDAVAPLTIVPRQTDPNAPVTQCGFLPTAEGDIHVLEMVLGRRLGKIKVGQPLTLGGWYDRGTRLVYFPADGKRVFAVNPAAIDDPQAPACQSVLFNDHSSGALRSEPVVVGQYLVLLEASELEHTRLKAYAVRSKGFHNPTAEPLKELSVKGWAWFAPHATPDRITLVTDQGELGLFGLNLDNESEAIYPIVQQTPGEAAVELPSRDPFRTAVVWAEEHLVWIVAGGRLQKLAVDLLRQEIHPLWTENDDAGARLGAPVHEPHVDRRDGVFYLTTMSESGQEYRATAVDSETGRTRWESRLGVSILGDPFAWDDRVVILDRSGETINFRPGEKISDSLVPRTMQLALGEALPDGADENRMIRLGELPGPVHLVLPMDDGKRLAVRSISSSPDAQSDWTELVLDNRLHGRPCVCGDFLVVPCDDGQLYRFPLDGGGASAAENEIAFTWARSLPPGPNVAEAYPLGPDDVLLVDDDLRRLRRLSRQTTAEGVAQWKQQGRDFFLAAAMRGRPLVREDGLFVFDAAGTFYRLDRSDPNRLLAKWSYQVKVAEGPFERGGQILAIDDQMRIVGFAADAPGDAVEPAWVSEPFAGYVRGVPAAAGELLLVADSSRYVTGLRLSDGKAAWRAPLGVRVGPSASPVPYGKGRMLVPLADGTLLLLSIPAEQLAEATP